MMLESAVQIYPVHQMVQETWNVLHLLPQLLLLPLPLPQQLPLLQLLLLHLPQQLQLLLPQQPLLLKQLQQQLIAVKNLEVLNLEAKKGRKAKKRKERRERRERKERKEARKRKENKNSINVCSNVFAVAWIRNNW